jgi:UDP-2-acetamido-3-amino-2,3-dideoxy-glucuronate N-acetyltransferase
MPIDPTAEVESDVEIGPGTLIGSHVHARGPARIGQDCIVAEKTYIADGVDIGDRVKIDAFVYLCNGVVVEHGVMIGAGVVFTNDRYPRATTPDLETLRESPGPDVQPTWVREGATVGAGAVIGPGLAIGRFAMVGMGSAVTRDVPPFHLVIGSPAVRVALVCRCGNPMLRFRAGTVPDAGAVTCDVCGWRYKVDAGDVVELDTR